MRLQAQGASSQALGQGQGQGQGHVGEIAGLVEKELEQATATSAACLVR